MKRLISVLFLVVMMVVALGARPALAGTSACGGSYIVQRGDYLSQIARTCGVTLTALLNANPGITNPNIIYVGMVLVIPDGTNPVPTAAPTVAPGGDTYIVQRGDTLRIIANRFGTTVAAIVAVNPAITNPNIIYVGQRIKLPSGTSPVPTPVPTVNPGGSTYIVQRGDTLRIIANRFGTTVAAILAVNPAITNPNIIYVGQRIKLPGGGTTPPVSGAWVSISPTTGTPGTVITVTAAGFPANADVDVRLGLQGGGTQVVVDAKIDSAGNLSKTITLPGSAAAGEKWVVVVVTTELANGVMRTSGVFTVK